MENEQISYDEKETCWHIMTVSRGGTVSILKNLDAFSARECYKRLKPDSHPRQYINWVQQKRGLIAAGGWRNCQDGDIVQVKIIGPEGAELDPWKGVPPKIIDLSIDREKERRALFENAPTSQ